jgi:hypothetical protein
MSMPTRKPLEEIDFRSIIRDIEAHTQALEESHRTGEEMDEDLTVYLIEGLMKTVYGENVFDVIYDRIRNSTSYNLQGEEH